MKYCSAFLFVFLPFMSPAKNHVPKSIYDFKVKDRFGKTIDFADFKGKKILIVNAPGMATTSAQYAELEKLYQSHKNNLVIIGFLSEDFQLRPGGKIDLSNLDKRDYHVTFPLTGLAEVKGDGDNLSPVYKWLLHSQYSHYKDTDVQWDFQKYIINEKGELVAEFPSDVSANSPEVLKVINE